MKTITLSQWGKMSPRKRSWLVCHARGEKASVFWHCVLPSGETVGGSYKSKRHCEGMIEAARTLTAKEARQMAIPYPHPMADTHAEPVVAYPLYAEYDHVGMRLGMSILRDYGSFALTTKEGTVTAASNGIGASGESIEEAVSLLALKLWGLVL